MDVRFYLNVVWLVILLFDKIVWVWDVDNVSGWVRWWVWLGMEGLGVSCECGVCSVSGSLGLGWGGGGVGEIGVGEGDVKFGI